MNYALVEVVGNIKNAAYNSFFIKKSILIKISLWLLNIQVFVQIFTQFLCAKVELDYYKNEGIKYLEKTNLHILQKMLIKKLTEKLK